MKLLLSAPICLILCSLPAWANGDTCHTTRPSTKHQLDKRVTNSLTYSQLVEKNPWEQGNLTPTDWQQQRLHECATVVLNTPGAINARRAQNLSESKHFAEAIAEWTLAIDKYGNDNDPQNTIGLDPDWLFRRAQIYLKLGRTKDALADLERAVALKRSSPEVKFHAAAILTELEELSRAESILPPPNSVQPLFEPYFYYLQAVIQQKLGHKESARQTFLRAATLFAAAGMSPPAQCCLDAATTLNERSEKLHHKITIADLKPPHSNYDKIKTLLQALATKPDVFDLHVLSGLTGAVRFVESGTQYIANPCDTHLKEVSSVCIDKLEGGGKRLNVYLEPVLCSINKSCMKGLLKTPVTVPQTWRQDLAYSNAYKVPAGTLVLTVLNGGFHSIWRAELYSKDATYPEPARKPTIGRDSEQLKSYTRHMAVTESLGFGSLDHAQKVVTQWLREAPEDPAAHMYQAEILLKQHKLEESLASIETAMKYGGGGGYLGDKHSGNILQVMRGNCLLEMGKFAEAYSTFEEALPLKPSSDQLLLRARAEIGLKRFAAAARDLKEASKKFYEETRIVKRDETDKLLSAISAEPGTYSAQETPQIPTKSESAPPSPLTTNADKSQLPE